MQATSTTRHFGPGEIKKATIAIAILTSTAIGVMTATVVRDAADNDTGRASMVTSATANREHAYGYQFLEQNLDLPTGGAAPAVNRDADYQVMEQNLNLPGSDIVPATDSTMDYRFLKMNLELPGSLPSVAANWRVIEENSWGENFNFDASAGEPIPSSADDLPQQRTGESAY